MYPAPTCKETAISRACSLRPRYYTDWTIAI